MARTIVSPNRTTHAPSACLAILPVSRDRLRSSIAIWTSFFILLFLHLSRAATRFPSAERAREMPAGVCLLSETQAIDQTVVTLAVLLLQVLEEATPPPD